jgi:hypothetical protein
VVEVYVYDTYVLVRPPPPWATFEELLEKLFFLAVSGDGKLSRPDVGATKF